MVEAWQPAGRVADPEGAGTGALLLYRRAGVIGHKLVVICRPAASQEHLMKERSLPAALTVEEGASSPGGRLPLDGRPAGPR